MKKGFALLTIAGICAYELLRGRRSLPTEQAACVNTEPKKCQNGVKNDEKTPKCYYIKGGGVWHSDAACRYIAGKSGVVCGTVSEANAAGKVRGCALCGE